jgi:hypothetical protein
MSIGLVFWVLMILWLLAIIGSRLGWDPRVGYISDFVLWFIIALLGWNDFGAMLHG